MFDQFSDPDLPLRGIFYTKKEAVGPKTRGFLSVLSYVCYPIPI